jgi:hypothetical protein
VELTAAGGGTIEVGEDTSIQDSSIIYGHVQIGAHCLFGKQIFVASRGHRFRDRPPWLIRDQDRQSLKHPRSPANLNEVQVKIEDDCWIGQSVVVTPGTYIGRGAVVGANTVVTSDIGPYEVHGGVPNRKIGLRLPFTPPSAICAKSDDSIPYFYRGFNLTQRALEKSRERGVVEAGPRVCIVMASSPVGRVCIKGTGFSERGELRLFLRINGSERVEHFISPGPFELSAEISTSPDCRTHDIPAMLRNYAVIEIDTDSKDHAPRYGIASAVTHPSEQT